MLRATLEEISREARIRCIRSDNQLEAVLYGVDRITDIDEGM